MFCRAKNGQEKYKMDNFACKVTNIYLTKAIDFTGVCYFIEICN